MLLCRWYAHLHRDVREVGCPYVLPIFISLALFYSISCRIARTFDTVPFLGLGFSLLFKVVYLMIGDLVALDGGSKAGLNVGFAPLQFYELRRFHACGHRIL